MMSGAALKAWPQTAPVMATGSAAQRGFSYLGLMFLVFAIGVGLAKAGAVWQIEVQREKEKELLFIGEQYAMAIASYYESTPGGVRQFPASLNDLLQDHRFPGVRRHLRKLYADPVTGGGEWGLVRQEGRITGVYSLSPERPLKKAGFPPAWAAFVSAGSYSAWQFIYAPGAPKAGQQSALGAGPENVFPPVQSVNPAQEGGGGSPGTHPPAPDPELQKKAACLAKRRGDAPACAHYCTEGGTVTDCTLCQASIARRYNACMSGDGLPPLYSGG